MNCKQCGTEFEGNFCPKCGAKAEMEIPVSSSPPQQEPSSKGRVPPFQDGNAEKEQKKKPIFLRWWFVLAAIVIIGGAIATIWGGGGDKIKWSELELGTMISEPPSTKGTLYENSAEQLWVSLDGISDSQYQDYLDDCISKGFTVDPQKGSSSYTAYNAEGYLLDMSHIGESLSITLEAPMEMGSIAWPTGTAGKLLPAPKSTVGKFEFEHDDSFCVYVGDTSKADYDEYIAACSEMGFQVDYDKGDTYYRADNADGYHVSIEYKGNNIMFVRIDAPAEDVQGSADKVELDNKAPEDVASEQQTKPAETIEDKRAPKNGFDPASNEIYQLAGYRVEIPEYWKSETRIDGGIQRYSETGGKVAMLQITAAAESDDAYPVTFEGLMDDNDNMIAMIEATAFREVTSYEVIDTGMVKGILYKGTLKEENTGLSGYGAWFAFASESDRNWCTLILCQTDNTDYSYTDDFMSIIQSIQPIEKKAEEEDPSETPEEPESTQEPVQNLTAENCPDLAALLALRDPADPSVPTFADKYNGQVIEFDGCVNAMQNHGTYTTRWDVLLGAGDFSENSMLGPNFHLTDVNFYDMNVSGGDSVSVGLNVRVIAKVGDYDPNSQLFELDIISMLVRD